MRFIKNITIIKRFGLFVSLIIVSLILWNTYVFFQNFKHEERLKMEIFATALEEFARNTNLDDTFNLESKVIENNTNIPSILIDENGKISSWQNLDSIKSLNPRYLESQLEKMKSQNKPISIKISEAKNQQVYYRNSDLLNKLTYYPLALILILVLFLSVIYLFYNSTKVAETNKLWTGMAKETAHQIGTPLSSLLGWIAILKMEKIDDKYIDEIEKDVHRLNTIAARFSKIGSIPERKKQNIVSTTKTTFDYLVSRTSKQISFSFSSEDQNIFVNINKELFDWVIENLMKNAIDAMKGRGRLTVAIQEYSKKVEITVSDTGKGIPKSEFKQIFRPGFTTKKRGWGLGLSLSKRIIQDYHNGRIIVQKSEVNKGTTFQILLDKIS
jgi:hypothetical protein